MGVVMGGENIDELYDHDEREGHCRQSKLPYNSLYSRLGNNLKYLQATCDEHVTTEDVVGWVIT